MIMTKFRSMLESCIELAAGRPYDLEVDCDTPEPEKAASSDPIRIRTP